MSGAQPQAKKKLTHIGQYEIGRTLGEGSFSKVKLATDVFSGKKFAIKIVDWSLVDDLDDQTECIDREIKIMKLLDHPNIVKLYDIISHRDDKQTFLVLEYVARGELFDYIVANGRIREPESRKFWRQLISAVEYCHAFLVVHRDLKPSNLLLDDTGSIKITDFGLSNTMTPGKLFTTWCGSLYYSAPEIVEEKKYVGPAVDVWSCGVILYALLNGRLPWSGKCLARDTPVLLHDGTLVPVQDVRVGDCLMGDDATPRHVLSLARGAEPMARVELLGGADGFTCNISHVLALKAPRYPQRRAHKIAFVVAQRNADDTVAALRVATHVAASAAEAKALFVAACDVTTAVESGARARELLKRKLAQLLGTRADEDVLLAHETIDIAVKDLIDAKKVDARLRSALRAYRVGCLQFPAAHGGDASAVDPYALAFLVGCGAEAVGERELEFCAPAALVLKRFASHVRACGASLRSAGGERWRLVASAVLVDAAVRGSLDDAALKCGSVETRRALLDGALDSPLLLRARCAATDALVASVKFVARTLGLRVVGGRATTATTERFSVTVLPVDQFYGFALDGNRRFVVGDGLIVTHNTDLEKIRQIVVADIAPADRDLSDGCLDLIYGCCTVDVKERLTIPQIRMHPWTNEGYDGPPPCNVPQTQPVAKVSEPVLQQLVFLGILDDSDEAHEQARNDIMANNQTQIVYAYHTLLGKPQLLVSASFLPRDKIKRAVSAARHESAAAAGSSRLATDVAGPDDEDDDTSSQSSAPPPPPPANPAPPATPPHSAATVADLQDLSDILGEIDGKAPSPAAQKSSNAMKQQQAAQAAVDALMGDLDALSASITASGKAPKIAVSTAIVPSRSPPPPPPAAQQQQQQQQSAKPTSPPSRKKSGHHVDSVETRRRSRTVSSGTGNSKPVKAADALKTRISATPKPKVVVVVDGAPSSAPSSPAPPAAGRPSPPAFAVPSGQPAPPPGAPPRSLAAAVAARDVQTRKRSMSLGQRSAPKPPPPVLNAIPADASTSATNLTSAAAVATPPREKAPTTAGSTWTSNLFKRKSKKKEDLLADAAAAAASTSSTTSGGFAATTALAVSTASAEGKTAGSTWDPSLYAKAKAATSGEVQITDELRTVTGVFKCATTSTRPALELVDAIERALGGMVNLKFKRKSQYLFRIADKKSKVRLEVEVVNVEKMERLHGIRFARIQGDTFVYKKLAEEVMQAIAGSV